MSSTDASERPESVLPWGETDECPVCEAAGAVCRYAYGLVIPPDGMSLEDYGLSPQHVPPTPLAPPTSLAPALPGRAQ